MICPDCGSDKKKVPPTLRHAAKALIDYNLKNHIQDQAASDGDDVVDQWQSEELGKLLEDLEEAYVKENK